MWGFDDYEEYDEEGEWLHRRAAHAIQCKHCKSIDVEWVQTAFGWKLFNFDGSFHDCKRVKASDFDDLTE